MKPFLLLLIGLFLLRQSTHSQVSPIFRLAQTKDTSIHLKEIDLNINEKTVVRDSVGLEIKYVYWTLMFNTGEYYLKEINPNVKRKEYTLIQLSDEEIIKNKVQHKIIPLIGSKYFKTGQAVPSFSVKDMYGNRFIIKKLRGKIIVLNFWHIKCKACISEMPELNQMVDSFKDNQDVVFLSVCLDKKWDIKDFLKTTPFKFNIIDDGGDIARIYDISSYPTNIIIDKEGKVYYHYVGTMPKMVYWIKRYVSELLEPKSVTN